MGARIRSTTILFVLVLALNALLAAYLWLPGSGIRSVLLPLPETVLIVLALWAVRDRRRLRLAVGVVIGVLAGFSIVEGAFQFIYARSFVPRIDIPMLSGLLFLLFGEIGNLAFVLRPVAFALIVALFVTVGVVVATVASWGLRAAAPTRRGIGSVTVLLIVPILILGPPRSLTALSTISWLDDGTVEFVRYDEAAGDAAGDAAESMKPATATPTSVDTPDATDPTVVAEPLPSYTFPGIKDRDIYLFAIEAYGYATFSREKLAGMVGPARDRFAEALRDRGYEFRSAFLLSPVAGGFSWLAEATLFTGQWIDSQNAFLQLYDAGLPTLTGTLHDGGYYTLTLKPGTVHATWPEGWDLFRFEEAMVAFDGDFNYVGPWFSYVPITDQFTLWAAHRRIAELTAPGGAAATRPFLAYYQLVSSHTPFNKIPPIIEDWDDLGDGSVYNERADEIRTFDNSWGGGTEMDEGYSTAISYVFDALAAYVDEHMDLSRDPIIIVYGDHQAQRPIREQDAHLSVPIHVASRDPEILALFEEEGFNRGLDGGQLPPHPRMSTFFPMFTRVARSEPPRIVRRGDGRGGTTR